MVAITRWGDKADIRQIVGRDRMSGRKSATVLHSPKSPVNPIALMSKGLQRV